MKWNHPDQLFVSVITKLAYHWALVRPCWLNTWARKSLYVCVHSGVKELGFCCLVTKSCPTFLQPHRLVCQRRQLHPTPVLLPGKSHGQRSLVGCSPWGLEDWDTTERLHFHFSLSCIREGNGDPLQWSCLENPRDGGTWWAAVYGVAQSPTRLKRLSSSNSSRPVCQSPLSTEFPRQEYQSGLPFLLQRIFPTQGLNPHLMHCRQILYHWATWEAKELGKRAKFE